MTKYFDDFKTTLIYVFRIDDEAHADCLKVGETTIDKSLADMLQMPPNSEALNQAARHRIDQYTRTAGIAYELLHTEPTIHTAGKGVGWFSDKDVHQVLLRSGIRRKQFAQGTGQGTEWFETNLETVKAAIRAVKEKRSSLLPSEIKASQERIIFRPEQKEAIEKTVKRFKKGSRMLWNAKMRFGKTLCALEVVRRMRLRRTLILTHRPVVNKGWYEDFQKIFHEDKDYRYASKSKGESVQGLLTEEACSFVYFASMQDLRGSAAVGGNFDKNDEIFRTEWDLLIVDEAHEGTQTALGKAVMRELTEGKTAKVLELSGTPFNLLDNFEGDDIYTWDYTMEQRAKAEWDATHFGDPNPYAELPRLNIFTYNLGRLLQEYDVEGDAFNFREFFRTNGTSGRFVHEKDVRAFLNLLSTEDEESLYPFANAPYRAIFRHTLWVLPGVSAARALSELLRKHQVFQYFDVVNVAGDGDEDEENRDALEMVQGKIGDDPDKTRTITLTCGRLTTGVSVKPWTGVLMLSGSYSTAAASYMQTIFRVQTPFKHNGRIKEDCYVFDFAPDRTLQVLASVPRVNAKAGRTSDAERRALGDFINFCPVISIEGSRMTTLDVNHMLQQLKKAYVEKVVRSGFENSYLYNNNLKELSDLEVEAFNNLKGIIGQTRAIGKVGNIDINNQGLTAEEYETTDQGKKPKPSASSPEELRKKKLRDEAVSILRGISIRMPLMIYGAELKDEDKELTIDNFTSLVDDQSWEEFIPRGVTKELFAQFKRYYDPEVFSAAGKRIRALARAADRMDVEERIARIAEIFGTFRNPDKETVLTPWKVVNMHLGDTLGGYCFWEKGADEPLEEPRYIERGPLTDEVFSPDARLLEINSKSGLYPLYLAYNIFRRRLRESLCAAETKQEQTQVWDEAVAENVYVICKTPMAVSITRRTLVGFRPARVNARYVENLVETIKERPDDFLSLVTDAQAFWKTNNDKNMKFNAVVGNPPYQEENVSNRKEPIYHLFYDIAFRLADKVSLITPARFLYKVGQTPLDWMEKILSDPHFAVVEYFNNSADVFPTVEIKGGIAIGLRDTAQELGPVGFFSEHEELRTILQKVNACADLSKENFSNVVSAQGIYKFSDELFSDCPRAKDVQGKGTGSKITSKTLENLPEVFIEEKPASGDYIGMLGRVGGQRVTRWIKRQYIQPTDSLDKYKVIVPQAFGTGALGEVISTPVVGTPGLGHTDTFLSIGKFESESEASHCLSYICTKFARAMLGTLKVTQNGPASSYGNVPLQNFSSASDIDWNQPLHLIDSQLYRKYGLDEAERKFIETRIKPM